jgi:hypothetical protein
MPARASTRNQSAPGILGVTEVFKNVLKSPDKHGWAFPLVMPLGMPAWLCGIKKNPYLGVKRLKNNKTKL